MDGWQQVTTLDDLERFIDLVGGFHDGILKEIHWVNNDYVDEALHMHPYKLANARMLVQRQWKPLSSVEMFLENIWNCSMSTEGFIFGSEAAVVMSPDTVGKPRPLLVLNMDGSMFAFERMWWRDATDGLGPAVRFGTFESPIPPLSD